MKRSYILGLVEFISRGEVYIGGGGSLYLGC